MASLRLAFNTQKRTPPPLSKGLLPRYNLNKPKSLFLLNKAFSPNSTTLKIKGSSVSSALTPQLNESTLVNEEDERPLSEIWKEIQGCNDWEGLLDPMNSHLRKEIIRYGEFAQASYDSFDFDPHSKYCGSCKYRGAQFFEKLDMQGHVNYQISRYLYATSNINLPNFFQKSKLSRVWSTHANWMGYVAVTTNEEEIKRLGRRDIVVAWRGTVTYLEWIYDLKDILCVANFTNDPSIKIELGFYDLYTKKENSCKYCTFSAREQVLAEIKRLLDYYRGEEISITITGHSLGAALATLSAYDIAEMRLNYMDDGEYRTRIPITVFSFSGPRVGNLKFKERCDELGVKVLRVINVHDKVPTVPGIIANEKSQFQRYIEDNLSFPWSYAHVGVELALDHTHSPFLQPTKDLGCAHNLEAHLHLVDGYHGKGQRFCLATKRDIALVNKSCDFLRREYGVPPYWRQDENGWCGNTNDYCGTGCQSQCGGASGDLGSIISSAKFDEMLKHRNDGGCPGKGFYTYNAFISAASAFPGFGTTGNADTRKREIAAFLGQTSHETTGGWQTAPDGPYAWGYCFVKEQNPGSYCSPSSTYPCAGGKQYYGRGPVQLSWNYNYGQCGKAIGVDLLNNPDLVATDPVISFKTAIWFWMTAQSPKPSCHSVITGNWSPSGADSAAGRVPGYGVLTNIINGGLECGMGWKQQVEDRIGFYKRYCDLLGVGYGNNLDCYNQRSFANGLFDSVDSM